MNAIERRATLSLASIFSFRMLGLFMILPVFTPYAIRLTHATPFLIGLAMGIYGFTQALLQLPFGTLSDYFPRKLIISTGLGLFIVGSVIAAVATSIYGVMLGRALQGGGAIGSTIIALLTDLTRAEQRSKAMAILGIVIGLAFILAMVMGPLLNPLIQVSGIFWLSAVLGGVSLILLYSVVPAAKPVVIPVVNSSLWCQFKLLLAQRDLLILDLGIFCLHIILTASFIVLPVLLPKSNWQIYFISLCVAIISCCPYYT